MDYSRAREELKPRLKDYVESVTGKSKGQTILQLMDTHNIQSAVYIGDTQGDLEACREAGIPFIFTSFGFGQPESWYAKADRFCDLLEVL